MASDLKSDLVMTVFQRRPTVHLMGNPTVVRFSSRSLRFLCCGPTKKFTCRTLPRMKTYKYFCFWTKRDLSWMVPLPWCKHQWSIILSKQVCKFVARNKYAVCQIFWILTRRQTALECDLCYLIRTLLVPVSIVWTDYNIMWERFTLFCTHCTSVLCIAANY